MKKLNAVLSEITREFKYINENNNTFIAEVENIFADGRRKMYEYLSLSAYTKSSTDTEMLEKLLLCTNKSQISNWITEFSSWWRVVPIILSPDSINLHIWDWPLLKDFTLIISKDFPIKRFEALLSSFFRYYHFFKEKPRDFFIKELFSSLIKRWSPIADTWASMFHRDVKIFTKDNYDKLFAEKQIQEYRLPEELFRIKYFPGNCEFWDFFQEYYLLTIDAASYYFGSKYSEQYKIWLLDRIFNKDKVKWKNLALAEFILVYIQDYDDSNLQKIFSLLEKPYDNKTWIRDNEFEGKRLERINQANIKINQLLNKSAFDHFFESFQFDEERKNYWSKYVMQFDSVKVYLPSSLFRKLSFKDRVSGRFFELGYYSAPPVLVMYTYPYCVVEFGIKGNALYVHHENDTIYKDIFTSINLKDASSFKDTSYDFLKRTADHGRIVHNYGWQRIMNYWISSKTKLKG